MLEQTKPNKAHEQFNSLLTSYLRMIDVARAACRLRLFYVYLLAVTMVHRPLPSPKSKSEKMIDSSFIHGEKCTDRERRQTDRA
jgi:hypothetical protein